MTQILVKKRNIRKLVSEVLDLETLVMMLDAGIDVDLVENGETFLMKAAETGDLDMARLLIDRKADLNLALPKGSPLFLALQKCHFGLVDELILLGADLNFTLMEILRREDTQEWMAKYLLENGAEVTATNLRFVADWRFELLPIFLKYASDEVKKALKSRVDLANEFGESEFSDLLMKKNWSESLSEKENICRNQR